ncbi:MAG TPA: methyltransferase domain-containing protein [Alphaproteobacteria bacterium]|nr:methyltransferase domain-containing protein [Alphaproteobacteria bacterium]
MPTPFDLKNSVLEQGLNALKRNNFLEAEAFFAQVISIDENDATAWAKLGLTWLKMGRFNEAANALTMANTLNPSADILHDLGLAQIQSGNEKAGFTTLEQSYRLKPEESIARLLGDAYYGLKDYQKSAYYYLKTYQTNKKDEQLQSNLSIALYRNGDIDQALGILVPLVIKRPTNKQYIHNLTDFYRRFPQHVFNTEAKKAIEICLKQDKLKFLNLRSAWSSLLLLDPDLEKLREFAKFSGEDKDRTVFLKDISKTLGSFYLCSGLIHSMASGIALENILTNLRKYFLMNWEEYENWTDDVLKFLAALAVQCWFNDFVYYITEPEKEKLAALKNELEKSLAAAEHKLPDAKAKLLALYCCFDPLYSIYQSDEKLPFSKSVLYILKPLVLHQLTNPRTEAALIPTIKSFTEIEDATSKEVQKMYEQRPYPRWTSANEEILSLEQRALGKGIEILVAGCGTGQEAAFYANMVPEAHITAVDLSRTSLAYAMRQADELGYLSRIDFLHGDLMQVGKLDKKFDFITSSGVLHHLKNPDKGLEAIRACLKPGGRMSLSLYSKPARDFVLNPASEYIREKGYTSSLDDIRQFRRDLFTMTMDNPIMRCTTAADFFNLAECNDLLFHVQEHRYTLKEFKEFGSSHNLEPFHLFLTPEKIKAFREMFPDKDLLDFDALAGFEEKFPNAFVEMYKVYFRPEGETSPHPLDPLIFMGAI